MLNSEQRLNEVEGQPTTEERWRRNQFATTALMMLDRLDVSPDDVERVAAIAAAIRKLGNMEESNG